MIDDTSKAIDALDCKTNLQHFERLFRYLVKRCAHRLGMTPEDLFEKVPETELRKAVRKAVDRFQPKARSITCYASWWLRAAVTRHVPRQPFTFVQSLPFDVRHSTS